LVSLSQAAQERGPLNGMSLSLNGELRAWRLNGLARDGGHSEEGRFEGG